MLRNPQQSLRVLAVEDDFLIQMVTTEMLSDLGHEVLQAANGDEALALLESREVDLLLADVGLVGMSGVELAVQAARKNPRLRIIFATGHQAVDGQEEHKELRRAVVLVKPFDEKGLVDAIDATR
jgi:CheY-like chemotaxis protein